MKKPRLLCLIPALLFSVAGCGNKPTSTYNENIIYNELEYVPLEIANPNPELYVSSLDLLGVHNGVMAAKWDDYDIKVRVKYSDSSIKDFDFKVKNIPLDMRHYLGEVGDHSIFLMEYKWMSSLDFTIIENPDWNGFKCEFFDKDKNLLSSKVVGFYEHVTYDGKPLPDFEEDYNYKYKFQGWNHSLQYIHEDTQFLAKYLMTEKRFYTNRPYNSDHIGLAALVDQDKKRGSGLSYLGRVRNVAVYYTEAQELADEPLEFEFEIDEYGKYWNDFTSSIVKYSVQYDEDSDYDSKVYGNPYELINNPNFSLQFDKRYDYTGFTAFLDDKQDAALSSLDPYESVYNEILRVLSNPTKATVEIDEEAGYYRYAITLSFDVYVSLSFNKLKDDVYEIAPFNSFIVAPVKDTTQVKIQHSLDEEFGGDAPSKLSISKRGIYYAADMIDWSSF